MRKIGILLLVVCLASVLTGCTGTARYAAIEIGESEKFTKDEIDAAVRVVRDSAFESTFVTKIVYDEARSDDVIRGYMETGLGSVNGVAAENVIVLYTDFLTGKCESSSLNPHDAYRDYNWILIRDGRDGAWRVSDCGYG